MNFSVTRLAIPDVLLIEHKVFADDRGSFTETFRAESFRELGLPELVQDNQSRSARGVVRGLHYQLDPAAVGKLVRCLAGAIFDVAVDLRHGSPHHGQWVGVELVGADNRMLYVPPGFGHGFMALEDETLVAYRQTGYWSAAHERSLLWNDPAIGIAWPDLPPLLSPKDAAAPPLAQAEHNFRYAAPIGGR